MRDLGIPLVEDRGEANRTSSEASSLLDSTYMKGQREEGIGQEKSQTTEQFWIWVEHMPHTRRASALKMQRRQEDTECPMYSTQYLCMWITISDIVKIIWIAIIIGCLLFPRHFTKHFTYILAFNLVRQVLIWVYLSYRWWGGVVEKYGNLLQALQSIRGEARLTSTTYPQMPGS